MSHPHFPGISRRQVLAAGTATAVTAAVPIQAQPEPVRQAAASPPTPIELLVNGKAHRLEIDVRTSLLDALREHLRLTGSKKGCDHGQCGACTVIVDGRRINSCMTLAVMQQGKAVTTIEGLGTPDGMHPMQEAFVKHDGFQCGYCTPGQICSAVAMLSEIRDGIPSHVTPDLTVPPKVSPAELRERMSGNICRCAAYPNIIAAIADASEPRA